MDIMTDELDELDEDYIKHMDLLDDADPAAIIVELRALRDICYEVPAKYGIDGETYDTLNLIIDGLKKKHGLEPIQQWDTGTLRGGMNHPNGT